jgi:hypothetical protein
VFDACGRGENATVTAYCFGLLDAELRPLKRAEAEGGLLPQARSAISILT